MVPKGAPGQDIALEEIENNNFKKKSDKEFLIANDNKGASTKIKNTDDSSDTDNIQMNEINNSDDTNNNEYSKLYADDFIEPLITSMLVYKLNSHPYK